MQQSQNIRSNSNQFQNKLFMGTPGDIIVNTEEQLETVNSQDAEEEELRKQQSDQKEKGYREGTRNDTEKQDQTNKPD